MNNISQNLVSWSSVSQKVTLAVGVIGGGVLITGVVLMALQGFGVLPTALLASGGGLIGADLIYFAVLRCKEKPQKIDGQFKKLSFSELSQLDAAITSKNNQEISSILEIIIKNWNMKKDDQAKWKKYGLVKNLGIDDTRFNQLLSYMLNQFFSCVPSSIYFSKGVNVKRLKFPEAGLSTREINKMLTDFQSALKKQIDGEAVQNDLDD